MPTITDVRIGAKLRARREESLLTQLELAEKSGVGVRSIVRIETENTEVRFSTIRKLAEALDVDPNSLVTRD